jgi:hypothetical protein
MAVNTLKPRATYTTRELALQAASNWYGHTIGYLPIEEGKGKNRALVTSIINPDDISTLLGRVQYERQTKEYILWLYPRCPTFRYIRAGDKVQIAGKGWGIAIMANMEQEVWVCTHGIASAQNAKSVIRARATPDCY